MAFIESIKEGVIVMNKKGISTRFQELYREIEGIAKDFKDLNLKRHFD